MPEERLPNVDQALFSEAIAEVKRLEGLLAQMPEVPKETLAGAALFEEKDPTAISAMSFEKVLEDALRVEAKLGITQGRVPAAAAPRAARAPYDEGGRKEQEELERMKRRFAEEEAGAKAAPAKAAEKPAAEAPSPRPAEPAGARKILAAAPPAKPEAKAPTAAVSEEEQRRMMGERLAKLMGKAAPKKTLFEKLEEKRPAAAQAPPPEEVKGKPQPEARMTGEEAKRAERAKLLKDEIAKKVAERMSAEEKRKREERLKDEIEKEMKEE